MTHAAANENGAQFFITLAEAPWLDGNYSVIGQLKEGEDVLLSLRQGDRLTSVRILSGEETLVPINWPQIESHWREVNEKKKIKAAQR